MYNIKTSVIMKKLMNLSKLAITALVTSSLFVACSEEISENTVDTKYTAQTGNIKNAGQAVDLGLPSGTLWANMNVGASSESDNGILFIWGDITGTKIDADNDATYTNVTSLTSFDELFKAFSDITNTGVFCDTAMIAQISQAKLIGKAEMSAREKKEAVLAFLRAKLDEYAGYSTGGTLEITLVNDGWTVLMNPGGEDRIPNLFTYFGYDKLENKEQDARKQEFPPDGVSVEDSLNYYAAYRYDKVTSISIEEVKQTAYDYNVSSLVNDGNNNYASIKDLVGKEIRKDYTGGTIGNAIKDISDPKKNKNLTFVPAYQISADANHDAATANWGNGWRMPTTEELAELQDTTYTKWEFVGNGYRVSSKANNNSIFLPAAGYRYGGKLYGNGNSGYYASGDIIGTYAYPSMKSQSDGSKGGYSSIDNMPSVLVFQNGQYNSIGVYNNMSASYGFSIRPVVNK